MQQFKVIICVLLCCFVSCNSEKDKEWKKGTFYEYFSSGRQGIEAGGARRIEITTPSGNFNVWIKDFGHNPAVKVLLLHGGPGGTHEYFECMESFLPREGIELIYYDQLGSFNSDHPQDTSLWNTGRFVEEVEQVRQALRLDRDNFYLLGHSWGGILAIEYALKYQAHLKGLIISNMMASGPAYGKYADEVLSRDINPVALDSIRLLEKNNDTQNPRYMQLLIPEFYEKHICRIPHDRWPEPLLRSFSRFNQEIYNIMQGPSEFGITGRLENWDRSGDLKNITVPSLVIGAKYDTMDPEYLKWMASAFPAGSWLYCPNGSHMCMYDDQEIYMNGLIDFIKKTDLASGKKNAKK